MPGNSGKSKELPSGCLAIFGLPFLLAGLALMWFAGIKPVITALDTRMNWVETPCAVVRSEIVGTTKDNSRPEVAYDYVYQGTHYTGTTANNTGTNALSGRTEARKFVTRHPAGKTDTCRINPKAPAESTLETDIAPSTWFVIPFGAVFALVGGGLMLAGIVAKKEKHGRVPDPEITRRKAGKSARNSRLIGLLFGLVFAGFGGAALIFFGILPAWKSHRAEKWDKVPCVILSSEVASHSGKSTTYSVDIEYEYNYSGKKLRSDRYDFSAGSSSGYDEKKAAAKRFPAGSRRECLVNPADPEEAVLTTNLGWPALALGFGLGGVFTAFGVLALWGVARAKYTTTGALAYERTTTDGKILLKPESGPVATFVALAVFALIWNGIISIPITQVAGSFVSGKSPQWGLGIFMGVFAAVGLLILYLAVKAFFALFSPRIRLELDRRPVPGEKLSLRWSVRGDSQKLRSLELNLEGYTETVTGSGKSRTAVKAVFQTLPLRRIEGILQESGSISTDLPAGLTPSDETHKWRITVRAKVSGGVNVSTDHPVEILAKQNPFA